MFPLVSPGIKPSTIGNQASIIIPLLNAICGCPGRNFVMPLKLRVRISHCAWEVLIRMDLRPDPKFVFLSGDGVGGFAW